MIKWYPNLVFIQLILKDSLKVTEKNECREQQKQSRKMTHPGYSQFNVSAVQRSNTLFLPLILMLAIGDALESLTLRVSE